MHGDYFLGQIPACIIVFKYITNESTGKCKRHMMVSNEHWHSIKW